MKQDEDSKEEQKQDAYSPRESSPTPETAGSSSFNDRSNSQSPSNASYQQSVNRGSDFQVSLDAGSSQLRQFPPIFGAIPVDPGSSFTGRAFTGSRESYDASDAAFAIDSRHGLPNDGYSQALSWYHTGPPAYM